MVIKMPAKKFLTFPELEDRWGCSEIDLRRLLIAGAIHPSYFIAADTKYSKAVVANDGMSAVQTDVDEEIRFYNQGIFMLDTPTPISVLDGHFGSILIPEKDLEHEHKHPAEMCYFLEVPISMSEVLKTGVLTIDEIERLESTQGKNHVEQRLDARERTSLLNIIGGLLDLMLGENERGQRRSEYRKQEAVIDDLLTVHRGKAGIAKSTLEAKFAAAKRSLSTE